MMDDPDALKKGAVLAATYDTLLQVGLRVVSFVLNAFIVRHVSAEVFAVMTVRLHLLYAMGLLLSREAFRRAALSSKGSRQIYKLVNLVWIGTLVYVPVGILGWWVWVYVMTSPPQAVTVKYSASVCLILASVGLEVATDVPYILAELQLWSKTKVVIEGLMQLLRSLITAVFIYVWPYEAVLMYGVSQLCGSLVYCASYYGLFAYVLHNKDATKKLPIQSFRQLFPHRERHKKMPEVDQELGALSWSFFKQGWLKEALTEGELYLMNFFPLISLAQQGVYQIVNNLGSLAVRLVFRSIEAAAYKYFAQMVDRGKPLNEQDQRRISEVVKFFSSLLQSLMCISIIIVTFGWSYSNLVLWLYGGMQLSQGIGTQLMRAQSFYIVFLAVNGITEAYTFAAMDERQLSRYNYALAVFSVAYIGAALIFTYIFGAVGFILANCSNMGLRITYSLWFIKKQFEKSQWQPLASLFIQPRHFLVLGMVWVITAVSEVVLYSWSTVSHVGVGGVCFLAVVYCLRWELKLVIEKVLQLVAKVIGRFGSTVATIHYCAGKECQQEVDIEVNLLQR
ncbi:hypothetical protein Pcinc_029562 [Petrolisthes cinctipes]|uniref:Protein RFT1 homolog n=1 Tax=Petrolisthes cinctipes TaxID=88211 RepID=A0AAE1F0S1_PETCI|nr:hypothetical protein Pcinc_029562 [Petrolisthes cinctipes]